MAKSRKVFIEVIVDDKGTTKKLAVDANKLEKALEGSSKQTKNADRALRGAASMSSNTTKNFSKMTQGINGGIVPAYAELAARVFAVTAAFRFLQEAADTRNLVQGQKAFGALMGTNYAGITKALQEATDGQLRFADAAQATAIGTAAGLTEKQLVGLSTAAKNVSFALGRDLTDSFNRLIRGVTKAEPELLDELGIILRLDPAVKAYKDQIGAVGRELTAFERSQAVANFVLEEADRKFNRIAQVLDKDAFAVAQFGKAFDDVLKEIKITLANSLTPVLKFLTSNVNSLIAVFGLLALPLIKSVLPNLDEFAKSANVGAKAARKFADSAQKDFDRLSAKASLLGKKTGDLNKQSAKLAGGTPLATEGKSQNTAAGFLAGGDATPTNRGRAAAEKALRGAEKQLKNSTEVRTGILKGMNAQQVADLKTSYKLRERVLKGHEMQVKLSFKGMQLSARKSLAGIELFAIKSFGRIATAAKVLARGVNLAFGAIGFAGFALLLVDLGKTAYEAFFPMSEQAKKAKKEVEGLVDKNNELTEFLSDVNQLSRESGLLTLTERIQQLGGAVRDTDVTSLVKQINKLSTMDRTSDRFKELRASLMGTTRELTLINPQFKELFVAAARVQKIDGKNFIEIAKGMAEASAAAASLANATKAVNQEINKIINDIPQAPLENLVSAFQEKLTAEVTVRTAAADGGELERAVAQQEKIIKDAGLKTKEIVTEGNFFGTKDELQGKTITVPAPDKEAIKKAAKEIEALYAQSFQQGMDVFITQGSLDMAQQAAANQLKNIADITKNRKEAAAIDKVSQSFDAQRVRTAIKVLNAENKVSEAKNAQISAETALKLLGEDPDKESQQFKNATRAVELAKDGVTAANSELTTQEALSTVENTRINAAQQRLKITKDINAAEQALARARISQERATSAGAGTVGKSLFDIGREKRLARENNILSEQGIITDKILAAETRRAELDAVTDAVAIENLNKQIELLKIKGEQLTRNLEIEQNGVLIDIEKGRLRLEEQRLQTSLISLNPVREEAEARILKLRQEEGTVSAEQVATIYAQTEALQEQKIIQAGLEGVVNSIQSGMESGLMSIIDGTKSAKQAFADFAVSVLKSIAQMIVKMLVFRALSSMGFSMGGVAQPPTGQIGGRYGGVMEGYSTGGIARGRQAGYPVTLHGTEAVVPLPNKKEIPVDLKGSAGNTNNISISIATDGSTRQEEGSGDNQSRRLGRVISVAVQDELQRQKRPGGILSPYGAA